METQSKKKGCTSGDGASGGVSSAKCLKHENASSSDTTGVVKVPESWNICKRGRKSSKNKDQASAPVKRQRFDIVDTGSTVDTLEAICRAICANMSRHEEVQFDLDFSDILSCVDYRSILQNLFGGSTDCPDVGVVSKVYEESHLRAPFKGERACAMGESCEGHYIDRTKPFTLVEINVPGAAITPMGNLCVLCSRKQTQRLFYDYLYKGSTAQCTGVIQRYGNLIDVPGEYNKECCLIMPSHGAVHCMPFPTVAYQRNQYDVYVQNMHHYIRQSSSMDFRSVPEH
jgi:hypothetical protein